MKMLILLSSMLLLGSRVVLGTDNCDDCIALSSKYGFLINHLVSHSQLILNCEQLSNELLNRTGNLDAYKVCDMLCNSIGMKNFLHANTESNRNPLLFCKMVGQCNHEGLASFGDAKILSVDIVPPVVPHGSSFQIIMTFQTQNGTMDGNAHLKIDNSESPYPVLNWHGVEAKPPGIYKVTWDYTASLDPNCPEKCEEWQPGIYKADIAICSGSCIGCGICSVYDEVTKDFQVVRA